MSNAIRTETPKLSRIARFLTYEFGFAVTLLAVSYINHLGVTQMVIRNAATTASIYHVLDISLQWIAVITEVSLILLMVFTPLYFLYKYFRDRGKPSKPTLEELILQSLRESAEQHGALLQEIRGLRQDMKEREGRL